MYLQTFNDHIIIKVWLRKGPSGHQIWTHLVVEKPSGYDIHSSPWKITMLLIGKLSISIRAIYIQFAMLVITRGYPLLWIVSKHRYMIWKTHMKTHENRRMIYHLVI